MDDFLKAQASLNSEITLMRDNLSLLCDKRHILDDEIEKLQSYIRRVSSDSSASLDMIETAQGNRKIAKLSLSLSLAFPLRCLVCEIFLRLLVFCLN